MAQDSQPKVANSKQFFKFLKFILPTVQTMAANVRKMALQPRHRYICSPLRLHLREYSASTAQTKIAEPASTLSTGPHISKSLLSQDQRSDLKNTTWNQLVFFRSLNEHYSSLVTEDQYDERPVVHGNSRPFWRHIITEYEVRICFPFWFI